MKFICENPDCEKFGIEDEYFTNLYKYVDGKMQSNNAPCPKCGKIRKEINPNKDIPICEKNIQHAKFSSSSPEQQRQMLKKRSHDHYKKEVEPFKEHQLKTAAENFKKASE